MYSAEQALNKWRSCIMTIIIIIIKDSRRKRVDNKTSQVSWGQNGETLNIPLRNFNFRLWILKK